MKKIITTVCAIFLASWCHSQGRVEVRGIIKNASSGYLQFSYIDNYINHYTPTMDSVPIDSQGGFSLSMQVSGPKEANIIIGNKTLWFYIYPGDSIFLETDYKELEKSLTFSGTRSRENNYRTAYFLDFIDKGGPVSEFGDFIRNHTRQSFFAQYDSLLLAQIDLLEAYFPDTTYIFFRTQRKIIECNMLSNFIMRHFLYNNGNHLSKQEIEDRINQFDIKYDSILANSNECQMFLVEYARYWYFNEMRETLMKLKGKAAQKDYFFDYVMERYNGQIRDLLLGIQVYQTAKMKSSEEAKELLEQYRKVNIDPIYIKYIEMELEKNVSISNGQPAPDHAFINFDRKPVKISDFRGKVIYLDAWARWCGPCRGEFPNSAKLEEHFKNNEEVVFLYINIGDSYEDWKETVAKYDLNGIHLQVPEPFQKNKFQETYNFAGIPKYILIGKDGNIIRRNAYRPSHPEVIEMIEDALNQ